MAIRMMVGEEKVGQPNVEIVRNYNGHEEGRVMHCSECPHSNEHDMSGKLSSECFPDYGKEHGRCWVMGPLYMETTYQGLVLDLGEYNGRDDSDFYAVVWDRDNKCTKRVEYASTRGWTYPNGASVDATPEVLAEYEAYCKEKQAQIEAQRQQAEAQTPRKGKTLKVVKGRKVPIGTVGECIWTGPDSYRPNHTRVGIKDAAGTVHWTSADNVVVV